ncbi:MAG: hypothetical protein QOG05_5773 [Streptosporangiaceae bacterium]|nr:hypothetical protein [Streptosporangiaceae bacterium]
MTPSTVAPPKPSTGPGPAVMAAGKSSAGADASLRSASCPGVRVISSESRFARSCSAVRAPMSVEVIPGRLRTQASAAFAGLAPISAATRATASMMPQSRSPGPPSRLAHLARAIRWICGHYDQTLRVEELAALAAMSVTSFHRHFRAVTSMTPIQFQKQIRLREARARLLAEPGDVSGAGYAVGYDSPSQFSREYRRMFGVPPSRDALALREAAVLPSI